MVGTAKETEFLCKEPRFKLAAKDWGDGLDKKIYAFHGWMDNAASFDFIAPLFADHGVVAVDLPGHGQSSHATSYFYHLTEYMLAMHQMLPGEPCVLMGHSLGAALISMFAGLFPDRVRALVLLDGLGPLTEPPSQMPDRLVRFMQLRAEVPPSDKPVAADALIRKRMELNKISRASAGALIERNLSAGKADEARFWSMDLRLRLPSPFRYTEEQVLSVLKRIACPTLLVKTDEEQGLGAFLPSRRGAVKGLRVVEVKGCHHVHMEQPGMVYEIIQSFLKDNGL
jgi:pimeloyl-ACP methyl ester carboxylesterase